ncbi:MAG: TolC family protein [Bacteroidales bacterium]
MASAYEQQESLARKSGSPNIMVGADYIITGKSNMPEVSGSGKDAIVFPMVGISVPIYQKKYASMEKEAQLMQQSVEAQKADRTNKLESDFETANKDYNDAGRRIPLFKLQSERANKALSILQTEYETDGKNFEEILRMERQLLKYKLELEKARSDKGAAIAYIEYLMGQ